jgi:hypothetical protein
MCCEYVFCLTRAAIPLDWGVPDTVNSCIVSSNMVSRFSEFPLHDLDTIRNALIRQLPELAKAVVEEAEHTDQGTSFDNLADAVRLIQELDNAMAAGGKTLTNGDPFSTVTSAEEPKIPL